MLAKLKKVKLDTVGKNSHYTALLTCPEGKNLFIHFDYSGSTGNYWPSKVSYNGKKMDAKLAWYTSKVEKMKVQDFLEVIAGKINKKYNV